jgi:hypothetical protein
MAEKIGTKEKIQVEEQQKSLKVSNILSTRSKRCCKVGEGDVPHHAAWLDPISAEC